MAIEININQAKIGTDFIAVRTVPDNKNAKAIIVAYAIDTRLEGDGVFEEVVIGGIPLSISSYIFEPDPRNPSDVPDYPNATILSNIYYALDIIEITGVEDGQNTQYDDNTFTYEGYRLSNLRQANRNYINIFAEGEALQAYHNTTIQGLHFALDENRKLIVNRTAYTLDDIETIDPSNNNMDIKEFAIGGVPLTAGRIGNKYYLIVNVLPNS